MKAVSDKVLDSHEDVAMIGLKAMRAFLVYEGRDLASELLRKAKAR